jgi:membrane fusion protein (multidrug efflux system)/multidrug efflux system membrane fusion protein
VITGSVRRWPATLLMLPLATLACGRSQGAPAPAGGAREALRVRVAPAAVRDVAFAVKAVGSLEAEEVVQVTAEVEGAVSEVLFHEGARVTPQTVLLRIDPDRYTLEAQRAEATYQKALADQRRAEEDLTRREALAEDQLVAAEELNRSRGEAGRLTAETAAAKAAWGIAEQNRRRSEVRPSRAGVINTRAVETGRFVKTGDVLATLVDVSRLRLRFKVSESVSLTASEGETVRFRVGALGERDFEGRIYHVGVTADPSSRQVEVMAWVKNPGVLKPGFFAEVALTTESRKAAVVVPEGAIQASDRGFVVYAVDAGKATLRPVQLGLRTEDGVVEILSGLQGGETVVVEGSDRLRDGIPVQVGDGPAAGATVPGQARTAK